MEACYGGTNVMERSCAVARGIDINTCMCSVYGGFRFDPNISTDEFIAPEVPELQAGSGTGRLDLPTKSQWPFSE
jgi:hypothetical protein